MARPLRHESAPWKAPFSCGSDLEPAGIMPFAPELTLRGLRVGPATMTEKVRQTQA